MKIKYKIIGFSTLFLVLFTSCEDFFQVNDKELIGRDLVVANEEFMTGLWSNLYHSLNNGFQEVGSTMLANASDEADSNVPFGATSFFNEGSWNSYNTPYNKSWAFQYQGVNNAAYFLQISDTTTNKDFNFYHEYKNYPDNRAKYNKFLANLKSYRMDSKFFKAYFHFQLWKMYGNVPIVDKVITAEEAKNLQQASTTEMVSYISGLLNEIIAEYDGLENTPGSAYKSGKWDGNNLGRITKGAALALKCRLFLYAASPLHNEGSYNKAYCDSAAKAAASIINSNVYSVSIGYRKLQFNRTATNPENILDNRADILNNNFMEYSNYPKGGLAKYVNVPGVCSNATCPSQNLVDAYDKLSGYSDAAPFENRDVRFKQTIYCDGDLENGSFIESYRGGKDGIGDKNSTTTGYYLKKFVNDTVSLPVGSTAPHVWYIFRYSEVLLNYAEAVFNAYGNVQKGYITSGSDLSPEEAINIVRLRDGKNIGNIPIETPLTNDLIRRERQVELAFEGHRFWDVRRWNIANTTENKPLRGMNITLNSGIKTYDPSYVVENRKFVAGMELFPIPYTEMHLYPSWIQNWW
ncbi:MAG: RagB/SusD family nutrient uptake outer membrane protein [Paludibacter sp.]|nr:RagB/SusD family nutrient uptake outer membrane protein [Paludibacter sp.]